MSAAFYWVLIIVLFFVFLPLVAMCAITLIRNIYRKIKGKKSMGVAGWILVLLVSIVGIGLTPLLPYAISDAEAHTNEITSNIVVLKYNEKTGVRSFKLDGTLYKELDTVVSEGEFFDYSDDAVLDFGPIIANAVSEEQSFIEKYLKVVFRYPTRSLPIQSIKTEDMEKYMSLDRGSLFCDEDSLDEKIAFYRDFRNYTYFAQDYNTDENHRITLDYDAIEEIHELNYQEDISDAKKIIVDADYELRTIIGESNNGVLLREIGAIYHAPDGGLFVMRDENYNEDGTVELLVLSLTDSTESKLSAAFAKAKIL